MKQHTEECQEYRMKLAQEIVMYRKSHPNYCRFCKGVGGFYETYNPSGSGISLSAGTVTDFSPCEYCICEGNCPECGSEISEDEVCEECGWESGNQSGIPDYDRCLCWIEGEQKEMEALRSWMYAEGE